MIDNIFYEFLLEYINSRKDDLEKINIAKQSYENILNYINNLNNDIKLFNSKFQKTDKGYLYGLDKLAVRIRKEEHKQLKIYFLDRKLFNFKSKLNAKARTIRDGGPESKIIGYEIFLLFDAPEEVTVSSKTYNQWFANNLYNILSNDKLKSSYVHEFIHILDYKRVPADYLASRTKQKKSEQEKRDDLKKDFSSYINDPLELNAYFSQAAYELIQKIETTENKEEITQPNNPNKFVELFFNSFLKPQAKKYLNKENEKRFIKRIYSLWEKLNN